jgi:carbonic anhydrase
MPDRNTPAFDRRQFLIGTGLGLAAAAAAAAADRGDALGADAPTPAVSAKAALASLLAGNRHFQKGTPKCLPSTVRRAELANGQSPFAAILGCADSRVPAEIIFDHEPGDIFMIRVAGNFVDDGGLGSLEYAVAVLKAPLVMVLGHSSCGAVKAAVSYVKDGTTVPGAMMTFVHAIAPAAKATKSHAGDWVANAVAQNVRDGIAHLLSRSTILADARKAGTIDIVGAVYDLHSGAVTML